jgi:hypothetical protein
MRARNIEVAESLIHKNKIMKKIFIIAFSFVLFSSAVLAKTGVKIISGKYPLPDEDGKIAQEQHLWLANKQSSASHYSMTNAPKSCRNGTAGGYGAFGPLTKKDKEEEKYYVTMRWNYANWVEPESDLADGISKASGSVVVKSGSDFPKSGYVKIGSEYIRYSSRSGNKLKGLKRAYKGSAVSHGKGESAKLVYKYKGGQWKKVTRPVDINKKKKAWYKEKKVLVTNEKNGKKVVASILEAGPAIWTGRVGGLSPEAFDAIDAKNDTKCTFAFVDDDTKLGKVD